MGTRMAVAMEEGEGAVLARAATRPKMRFALDQRADGGKVGRRAAVRGQLPQSERRAAGHRGPRPTETRDAAGGRGEEARAFLEGVVSEQECGYLL